MAERQAGIRARGGFPWPGPADPAGWHLTRRRTRAVVGVLWLTAGCLQLQPFMFTSSFSADVLGSAALSQPTPLRDVITSMEHIVAAHPTVWNWLFALSELLVGLALVLTRDGRGARIACSCAVGWGLGVWIVGEGAGGLFTGHAALSTGAPGAALLYVALTALAWPRPTPDHGEEPVSLPWLVGTWCGVWLIGAGLSLLPEQFGARGLGAQAAMGWMMAPSWLAGPALNVTTWLHDLPPIAAAALSALLTALEMAVAAGGRRRGSAGTAAVCGGAILAVGFWVFTQGLGGVSTGTATDIGTAPLLLLLATLILHRRRQTRLTLERPNGVGWSNRPDAHGRSSSLAPTLG